MLLVSNFLPRGFGAMTLWSLILIRPGMLGDAG
jgi:hypothetical protein